MSRPKLDPRVRGLLEGSGLPWEAEEGTNHTKLRVCGRLVQVVPRKGARNHDGRQLANSLASIRRAIRELGGAA